MCIDGNDAEFIRNKQTDLWIHLHMDTQLYMLVCTEILNPHDPGSALIQNSFIGFNCMLTSSSLTLDMKRRIKTLLQLAFISHATKGDKK